MFSFTLRRILFTLVIILVSYGCSVNKRYHNSGIGIQWHLNLKPVNSYSKIGFDTKKKTELAKHNNATHNNISVICFNSNDRIEALSETIKTTLIKPTLSFESSNNQSNFYHQISYTKDAIEIDKKNVLTALLDPFEKKLCIKMRPKMPMGH